MAQYYFCLKHHAVEPEEGCRAIHRLGPYDTEQEAEHALEKVAERNEAWDNADRDWDDGGGGDGGEDVGGASPQR